MAPRRSRVAGLGLLVGLIVSAVAAPAALAADADDGCVLSASPASGRPGTEFTFTGSGFTPTVLELSQGDEPPTVIELELGDDDPFEIKVIAREGDEGAWTAVAKVPGSGCEGVARITVTLPSTSTADASAGQDGGARSMALAALGALALVFVLSARLLVGRVQRRA